MSSSNPFPPHPQRRLTRDEVVNYLVACKADGYVVYQDGENKFVLPLSDDEEVRLSLDLPAGTCQVISFRLGSSVRGNAATTVAQLERALAEAVRACGHEWPCRPTTGRLSAATPATNYRTISQLIASAQVEAVFDPYLENGSLITLLDILSFGSGGVANGVRLLGSTRTTHGPIPRFTKTGVDAWLAQLDIAGEARVMPPNDQHRRFMLLSGGQSLILGPSLNSIHKNEATHLESDTQDRLFFDSVWTTATPL
jgi:hypothetical protein